MSFLINIFIILQVTVLRGRITKTMSANCVLQGHISTRLVNQGRQLVLNALTLLLLLNPAQQKLKHVKVKKNKHIAHVPDG